MTVRIRLQRHGAKKRPFYRVVAADQRARRDGRFIELLGTYDPLQDPPAIRLKKDRVDYWLGVGAQPSDTANYLINKLNAGEALNLTDESAEKAAIEAKRAARQERIAADRKANADALAKAVADAAAAATAAPAAEGAEEAATEEA